MSTINETIKEFFRSEGWEEEVVETIDADSTDEYFTVGGQEWIALTEDEAYERARNYIEETLGYFNTEFLSNLTNLPEIVFENLPDEHEAVKAIVDATCGMDKFVSDAIREDGRGSFLSTYDGEEYEADDLLLYRTN